MAILTREYLGQINERIRSITKDVEREARLKSDCHFSHMLGNIIQNLYFISGYDELFQESKQEVIKLLREVDEYLIAIGNKDKFREYEFTPRLRCFRTTKRGFIGYTKMMSGQF